MGRHLYAQLDLVARVWRGEDKAITRGELLEFTAVKVVSTEDALASLDKWFKDVGGEEWRGEDVLEKLGRGKHDD